jgi:hypothetical protein
VPTPWQNLKTQIALPPYNGQSDAVNQSQLNALVVTQDVNGNLSYASLDPDMVRQTLAFQNTEDWGWIVQIANNVTAVGGTANNNGSNPQTITAVTQRACMQYRDIFAPGAKSIPMNASRVTQFNTGLSYLSGASVNVISAAGASAVQALMTTSQLWPYANGFSRLLDLQDFNAARAS